MNRVKNMNMYEDLDAIIDGKQVGFEANGHDAKVLQRELLQDQKPQRNFSIPTETASEQQTETGPRHRAEKRSLLAKLAIGRR